MAETKMVKFSLREIAEILVKRQKIHDGLWGIYVKFGISAANIPHQAGEKESVSKERNILPAAIVPVLELGIQQFDSPNSLTVNAAQINPKPPKRRRGSGRKKG